MLVMWVWMPEIPSWSGRAPHTAADGLVVHIGPVAGYVVAADNHVVHGALRRCRDAVGQGLAHRGQQHVGNALRRFHVAAGDTTLRLWVNEAANRRDYVNRTQTALVRRRFTADHASHDIQAG